MMDDREPTVDSDARRAILETLAAKQKQKEQPKKSFDSNSEVDETTPFSELLERSLQKRDEVAEIDESHKDEARKNAIENSDIDMIGELVKRMR